MTHREEISLTVKAGKRIFNKNSQIKL